METEQIYRNLGTKREVTILQRRNNKVQVRYIGSGNITWYKDEDFKRIFVLL